jgi:phosphatidylinositol alpha-mannosyltransferase
VRILLACPYDWGAPGGVQVHVRELAEGLRRRGHEMRVVAPGAAAALDPWVRIVGRPIRVPYRGTVAPISFSPGAWRRIRSAMRSFDAEVVHVHEPLTPSTSMLVALAAGVPVVATFHAYLDRSRLMELAGPALRRVSRRIDAGIAVSEAAAEFLRRAIAIPVEIVPNGVDVGRFAHPVAPARGLPDGRKILWVNRLDPQKGFGVLLEAFQRLPSSFDDVRLVVVGDGKDRDELRSLPELVRLRVLHLGTVAHDLLPAYHAAANLSVSAAVGQESFGIVLVEAMAAGLPVICTDIPGYREVVRDGIDGLLVPPNDPAALADAIAKVLSDRELASSLAEAGRVRAAEFSWDAVLPRLEAVYERVIAPGGAPADAG